MAQLSPASASVSGPFSLASRKGAAKSLKMNEEVLNTSLRKFLKTVGVTSQREIEKAIRTAVADGRLKGNESLSAQMVLTIGKVGLNHKIEGTIELD